MGRFMGYIFFLAVLIFLNCNQVLSESAELQVSEIKYCTGALRLDYCPYVVSLFYLCFFSFYLWHSSMLGLSDITFGRPKSRRTLKKTRATVSGMAHAKAHLVVRRVESTTIMPMRERPCRSNFHLMKWTSHLSVRNSSINSVSCRIDLYYNAIDLDDMWNPHVDSQWEQ